MFTEWWAVARGVFLSLASDETTVRAFQLVAVVMGTIVAAASLPRAYRSALRWFGYGGGVLTADEEASVDELERRIRKLMATLQPQQNGEYERTLRKLQSRPIPRNKHKECLVPDEMIARGRNAIERDFRLAVGEAVDAGKPDVIGDESGNALRRCLQSLIRAANNVAAAVAAKVAALYRALAAVYVLIESQEIDPRTGYATKNGALELGYRRAIDTYRKATELEPDRIETWLALGSLCYDSNYRRLGDVAFWEAARRAPEYKLSQDVIRSKAASESAAKLYTDGNYEQALLSYKCALAKLGIEKENLLSEAFGATDGQSTTFESLDRTSAILVAAAGAGDAAKKLERTQAARSYYGGAYNAAIAFANDLRPANSSRFG